MQTIVNKVVIVGGGTAGWMAAASLAHQLAHLKLDITLIESSDIGTVGVGEATVPAIRDYIASLGLDIFDVMRATQGTAKLGIEYVGWSGEGRRFFHPFGAYGVPAGQTAFHHIWHRLRELGDGTPLAAYNLCTQLALSDRFMMPPAKPRAAFEAYDWAIHFDAGLFGRYLREFATQRGVKRVDAKVIDIAVEEGGQITHVRLDSDLSVDGDLFIDCSGFRGLLIQGALHSGYQNWKKWLPCDRAVALPCAFAAPETSGVQQSDARAGLTPYTRATALAAGWSWRIPLQHRIGNGYVYSSDHISDDEAEAVLRTRLEGEVLGNANRLRFTSGHATEVWKGNCIALGLAAGFLEPLESTSIVLVQTGIEKLIRLFPYAGFNAVTRAEFNRCTRLEYERIRDFLILHYWASARSEPMWRACQETDLPEPLRHKIEVFRAQGHLVRYEWESFHDPSWLSMYAGFGIAARSRDPSADRLEPDQLRNIAERLRTDVTMLANQAYLHGNYIKRVLEDSK
jgi:tryptophan halogenase